MYDRRVHEIRGFEPVSHGPRSRRWPSSSQRQSLEVTISSVILKSMDFPTNSFTKEILYLHIKIVAFSSVLNWNVFLHIPPITPQLERLMAEVLLEDSRVRLIEGFWR